LAIDFDGIQDGSNPDTKSNINFDILTNFEMPSLVDDYLL